MDFLGVTRTVFDKLREERQLKPAPLKGGQERFSRLHLLKVKEQLEGVTA